MRSALSNLAQTSAGNAAVARLLAREAAADVDPPPEPLTKYDRYWDVTSTAAPKPDGGGESAS